MTSLAKAWQWIGKPFSESTAAPMMAPCLSPDDWRLCQKLVNTRRACLLRIWPGVSRRPSNSAALKLLRDAAVSEFSQCSTGQETLHFARDSATEEANSEWRVIRPLPGFLQFADDAAELRYVVTR